MRSRRVDNVHIPVVLLEAPVQGTLLGNRLRAREVDRYAVSCIFLLLARVINQFDFVVDRKHAERLYNQWDFKEFDLKPALVVIDDSDTPGAFRQMFEDAEGKDFTTLMMHPALRTLQGRVLLLGGTHSSFAAQMRINENPSLVEHMPHMSSYRAPRYAMTRRCNVFFLSEHSALDIGHMAQLDNEEDVKKTQEMVIADWWTIVRSARMSWIAHGCPARHGKGRPPRGSSWHLVRAEVVSKLPTAMKTQLDDASALNDLWRLCTARQQYWELLCRFFDKVAVGAKEGLPFFPIMTRQEYNALSKEGSDFYRTIFRDCLRSIPWPHLREAIKIINDGRFYGSVETVKTGKLAEGVKLRWNTLQTAFTQQNHAVGFINRLVTFRYWAHKVLVAFGLSKEQWRQVTGIDLDDPYASEVGVKVVGQFSGKCPSESDTKSYVLDETSWIALHRCRMWREAMEAEVTGATVEYPPFPVPPAAAQPGEIVQKVEVPFGFEEYRPNMAPAGTLHVF